MEGRPKKQYRVVFFLCTNVGTVERFIVKIAAEVHAHPAVLPNPVRLEKFMPDNANEGSQASDDTKNAEKIFRTRINADFQDCFFTMKNRKDRKVYPPSAGVKTFSSSSSCTSW